jgi:hypothetical protein
MTTYVRPASESESDDDEWVDSEASSSSSSSLVLPLKTIHTVELPQLTRDTMKNIPEDLEILNLVTSGKKSFLYRCEPAERKYPAVRSNSLASGQTYLLQICLFNAAVDNTGGYQYVPMRLPDFKTKGLNFVRRNQTPDLQDRFGNVVDTSCVFVVAGKQGTISFKKKCTGASNKDIAFELGKGFLSHTGDTIPQFTIVAIPFNNGELALTRAIRTPLFEVWSKRQTSANPRNNKRAKKSSEIARYDTNISEASVTLNALKAQYETCLCRNRKFEVMLGTVRRRAAALPASSAKISYEYATREICPNTGETADI